MEVALMEGGIARLHNPTFLFRLSELTGLPQLRSLWTLAALVAISAIVAFGGIVRRARIVILRLLSRGFSPVSLPEAINDIIHSFSDDDDSDYENETCSSCSSSHEMEDDQQEEDNLRRGGCSFDCSEEEKGGFDGSDLWLAEMVSAKGVVRAWEDDQVRTEPRFHGQDDLVSYWDRSSDGLIRSFLASRGEEIPVPAVCVSSPGLVLSSGKEGDLRVWDARFGSSAPAMIADWQKPGARRRVQGIGTKGGDGKEVYLAEADGMAAGVIDLRNPKRGLAAAAGEIGGAFWSSSAVASWCRNATEFFPLLSPR